MNDLDNIPNEEHLTALFFDGLTDSFKKKGYTVEKKYDENGLVVSFIPPKKEEPSSSLQ